MSKRKLDEMIEQSVMASMTDKFGTSLEEYFNNQHVISPHSITTLLLVLYLKSSGKTRGELGELLKITDTMNVDDNTLLSMKEMFEKITKTSKDSKLRSCYGFFFKNFDEIRKEFIDFSQSIGKCDVLTTVEPINKWVSECTNGIIKELLSGNSIDEVTKVVLVNALYFAGKWSIEFASTGSRVGKFKRIDGTIVEGKFMRHSPNADKEFRYYEDDFVQAIRMNFTGDGFHFDIILPKDFGKWKSLNNDKIRKCLDKSDFQTVEVIFPKFNLKTRIFLKDILEKLGCSRIFDLDNTEFNGIMNDNKKIGISEIVHEANLTLNEKGVEAAAATAILMRSCAVSIANKPEITFNADKPFYFFICYELSVLFMGLFNGNFGKEEVKSTGAKFDPMFFARGNIETGFTEMDF